MPYCGHEDAPCCGCAAEMRGDYLASLDNDPYPEDDFYDYYDAQ